MEEEIGKICVIYCPAASAPGAAKAPGVHCRAEGGIQVYTRGSSFRPRQRNEIDDMIDRFHSAAKYRSSAA